MGDYSSILDDKHIFVEGRDTGYDPYFSWRFLLLHSESEQAHIPSTFKTDVCINSVFKHDTFIDLNYNRSLVCDRVFNRIMTGIHRISWRSEILDEVNKIASQFETNVLGVSIRSWTASHERNIKRSYDKQKYIDMIVNTVSATCNSIQTIFLSADNPSLYSEYMNDLNMYNVCFYEPPKHFTELQYVCVKLLLLSKCQFLIGSKLSTFTELSFWLSGCKQIIQTPDEA